MNLRSISKEELLKKTETLVADERRITTAILWHLYEIERRRLFAELGFSSLYEYCTLQLKYSAGSAQRRIASMRLLREIPEIAPKIDSGELSVSAVAQAQSLFRQARIGQKAFTTEAKRALVTRLENKSHRECEKILAEASPALSRPSRERAVSATKTEIRFEADDALYAKIQRLKAMHAHKLKGSNDFADLLEIIANKALEEKPTRSLPTSEVTPTQKRYIPIQVRKAAMQRARHKCTYVDPTTKRACLSNYALEFDHIKPFALGGYTEPANIRVLCRIHNQLAAIQTFGLRKMERILTPNAVAL